MVLNRPVFGHVTKNKFDDDFLLINQEELSSVVSGGSVVEIQDHLNNLASVPIIYRKSRCSTSSIEITSTENKENVRNEKNKKNATICKKEFKSKIKKKKSNLFCFICEKDREENMINCLKCKLWAHDLCAGVDKKIYL